MAGIVPNLWFDTEALEAAEFYVSVFPNSQVTNISYYGEGAMREAGTANTTHPPSPLPLSFPNHDSA